MRIGDKVYVRGYIDEIRYDDTKRINCVIIRNDGGYFGTVQSEIIMADQSEPKTEICDICKYHSNNIPCGSTPSACKEADKFAEEFVEGMKKLNPQTEREGEKMKFSEWLKTYPCPNCKHREECFIPGVCECTTFEPIADKSKTEWHWIEVDGEGDVMEKSRLCRECGHWEDGRCLLPCTHQSKQTDLFDLMHRFEELCHDIKMQLRQSSAEIASAIRERQNDNV